MRTRIVAAPWDVSIQTLNLIAREVYLSWRFTVRDISATVIPAMLFTIAAWRSQGASLESLVPTLLKSLIYFWLYCYTFCLSNQIAGLEEDRLNKPDRPLVAGEVSLRGAYLRWGVMMLLFTAVGWLFGVVEWALLWQIVLTLHNFGGIAKRWYGKNFAMSLGTAAELAAAWQIAAPITPFAWRWIGVLAIAMFPLFSAQDLRDMVGDRAIGRNTMPLAIGEQLTRRLLAVGFTLLPLLVYLVALAPTDNPVAAVACGAVLAIISFTVAVRLLWGRSPEADHRTYMLFTYWYCFALATAIIVA